jgi:hypothetical protein
MYKGLSFVGLLYADVSIDYIMLNGSSIEGTEDNHVKLQAVSWPSFEINIF